MRMKNIWKAVPSLAPVLAAGGVTVGAAAALGNYTVPAYQAEDFQIAVKKVEAPAGGAEDEKAELSSEESSEDSADRPRAKGSFNLEDGAYEGTGMGYRGEIKVSVKIQDQSVDAIEVLDYSDDESFFSRAREGVIGSILSSQKLDVDTVSGATYSSKGIISAVKNALTGAKSGGQTGGNTGAAGPVTVGKGDFDYEDGTYEGSASGFSGEVRVSVTVKDRTITAINILSHSDDESFFSRAKEGVNGSILSSQKLDVDAVSGATYSSNGIINAVKNALSGAGQTPQRGNTPAAAPSPIPNVKEPKAYKDGSYTGTGTGFGGELTVKVKISGGKIKKIRITKNSEGKEYLKKAKALLSKIVDQQRANVDAVSGATYSSNGIIEAVRNALSQAAVTGKTTPEPGKKPAATVSPTKTPSGAFPYPDGTYTGTGSGFGGPITVKVVIKDRGIDLVEIIGHEGEDEAFFDRAQRLTEEIVGKQKIDVDAVSGATYSSKGILEAVKDALENAKKASATGTPANIPAPSATPVPSATETPGPTPTPAASETPGGGSQQYKDGSYSATARCTADEWADFDDYNLNLTVVLAGGKITAIRNIYGDYDDDAAENDSFVSRAAEGTLSSPGVVSQILAKNSTEGIDTVSHATCSSRAIIEACRQALEKAKN